MIIDFKEYIDGFNDLCFQDKNDKIYEFKSKFKKKVKLDFVKDFDKDNGGRGTMTEYF